jgi:SprT-like family
LTRKSVISAVNALTISAPARAARLTVAGIDLAEEAARVRRLPVFAAGELAERPPAIRVRRARRRPNRLGFAVPDEWRVSVTAYPGIRPGDVRETLLHELVHLHVGSEPGRRRWHGRAFRDTLRRAMTEAYGLVGIAPANSLHGAYADALEALDARRAAAGAGVQLELPLAC